MKWNVSHHLASLTQLIQRHHLRRCSESYPMMNQSKSITASVLYSCLLPCLHCLFLMQEFSPGHLVIHTEGSIMTIAHQCVSQLVLWTNCLICWFKRQMPRTSFSPMQCIFFTKERLDYVISQTSPMVWCRWKLRITGLGCHYMVHPQSKLFSEKRYHFLVD